MTKSVLTTRQQLAEQLASFIRTCGGWRQSAAAQGFDHLRFEVRLSDNKLPSDLKRLGFELRLLSQSTRLDPWAMAEIIRVGNAQQFASTLSSTSSPTILSPLWDVGDRSRRALAIYLSFIFGAGASSAGCDCGGAGACRVQRWRYATASGRHTQPLSERMLTELQAKNMGKEPDLGARLQGRGGTGGLKQDRTERFALLRTYPICRWSGELGPKVKQGDRQAPRASTRSSPP
jgi:hypothetical protein